MPPVHLRLRLYAPRSLFNESIGGAAVNIHNAILNLDISWEGSVIKKLKLLKLWNLKRSSNFLRDIKEYIYIGWVLLYIMVHVYVAALHSTGEKLHNICLMRLVSIICIRNTVQMIYLVKIKNKEAEYAMGF